MRSYGLGAALVSAAPTGGNLDGVNHAEYTFSPVQTKVSVQLSPDAATYLWGRWNRLAADFANLAALQAAWDFVLQPGDRVTSPDGILVSSLVLGSDGALTAGTDFSARGFE